MLFKMSSAICFNLNQSKILSSGNGLMPKSKCRYIPSCRRNDLPSGLTPWGWRSQLSMPLIEAAPHF